MSLLLKLCRTTSGQVVAGMLGLLLLLAPVLASCGTPQPLELASIDLGIPAPALNSPVTGPLPDATQLHVRITFKIDPNLLKQSEQQTLHPGQKSSLENFASKLGIDDATYQKIKAFFSLGGITLKLSKLRTHLAIDAKASTFAKVLQTKFVIHRYNGNAFYAPATPPKLPQFLANSIDALTGLDNYSARPQHDMTMQFKTPSVKKHASQDCSPLDQTLLPKQVAKSYGYDQLWNHNWHGEGMTVNLVEIDGFDQNDIQNYFDCINFKGNLSVVDVDGSPSQALGESTLDVQMIAGLARSINIVDYETDGNASDDIWVHVNDELQQIINDNVNNANTGNVVSISLGDAEADMTGGDQRAIDQSIQQLTRVEHMQVFIASGDCGAFTTRRYGDLAVSFPASDPWAISVGGTILSTDANYNRTNEIAWSDGSDQSKCTNQWGSGGGNSTVFGRPSWQNTTGVSNRFSNGKRQVPDVSGAAYALAVYFQGQWSAVGGTSAAAPIWATGMALSNQGLKQTLHKFAFSPQIFYLAATKNGGRHPYYDVTRGNNLYFPATAGWDYATGLGTPNLWDFFNTVSQNIT